MHSAGNLRNCNGQSCDCCGTRGHILAFSTAGTIHSLTCSPCLWIVIFILSCLIQSNNQQHASKPSYQSFDWTDGSAKPPTGRMLRIFCWCFLGNICKLVHKWHQQTDLDLFSTKPQQSNEANSAVDISLFALVHPAHLFWCLLLIIPLPPWCFSFFC